MKEQSSPLKPIPPVLFTITRSDHYVESPYRRHRMAEKVRERYREVGVVAMLKPGFQGGLHSGQSVRLARTAEPKR